MKKVYLTNLLKLFTITFVLLNYGCTTSNDYTTKIQSDTESELNENTKGILVSINSIGKNIVWSGASGLSDTITKTKLQPDQTFRIASVTKTFVAATILRLWEDKRINLNDGTILNSYLISHNLK